MTDQYSMAIGDLLAQECTPELVRQIERGGDWRPFWKTLLESGFADALVPESDGGFGLALRDMFGVFDRCGAHALPVPLAETALARAMLAQAGMDSDARPCGPIVFAVGVRHARGLRCNIAPGARTADHVIVQEADTYRLLDMDAASTQGAGFALDLALDWPQKAVERAPALVLGAEWKNTDVRSLQACLYAALLAGVAGRVLDMTLAYAGQRVQFGRPIGKFQAVQHHLAVMSEEVAAARAAAEIGCLSPFVVPVRLNAALAKARASLAALEVAKLGHQLHGAIGFTEEFDLQLYTRRLHAWRRAGGSESAWYTVVGEALVHQHSGHTLDLVRSTLRLLPEPTP
jgi:acyl-CoA dehydrogenase